MERRVETFANCLSSKDTAPSGLDVRNRLREPQNDEKQEHQPVRRKRGDAGTGVMDDSRTFYADVVSHGLQYKDWYEVTWASSHWGMTLMGRQLSWSS